MKILLCLICCTLLVVSAQEAHSANKGEPSSASCEAKAWPLSRDLTWPEYLEQLPLMKREDLFSYALFDLVNPQEKPVFVPLLSYLGGTEQNSNLAGYYKAMGYFALGNKEMAPLVADWPKQRKSFAAKGFTLEEICKFYDSSRAPAQTKAGKERKKKK